ncbi:MAG: SRPBCC family protein [Chloroflexota bacterium]
MNQNYSATFTVDQTPEEAFAAINNPRGWWSQEIEGDTTELGAEFNYHYRDVHRAAFKITEFVPGKKVVWHVVDNYFNFIQDKNEWVDTDVVFEVAAKDGKTEVQFTHVGLVPAYECYDVCSNAWGTYITRSLHDLITTGKGQPNPIEEVVNQAREMRDQDYTTSLIVDQSPDAVFAAVNDVRGWWSQELEGDTDKLGAEFNVHFKDIHYSSHKITEFVPGKKVVWHTTDSRLNFISDKSEWTDTDIVFEIARKDDMTELRFTHVGLIRAIECYGSCSDAWAFYINNSLYRLITTGKGEPEPKENGADGEGAPLIKLNLTQE